MVEMAKLDNWTIGQLDNWTNALFLLQNFRCLISYVIYIL